MQEQPLASPEPSQTPTAPAETIVVSGTGSWEGTASDAPRIGGVAVRPGSDGPELTIDLSQPADFLFWGAPDGRRVVLFVPGAPMDAAGRGEGGLIQGWRCLEGPAPGCALTIDLNRPMSAARLALDRPEQTGGDYRVRLALEPLERAAFPRERTGIAWQGGERLPPLWPEGQVASNGASPPDTPPAEAPRSALAAGFAAPAPEETAQGPQPARLDTRLDTDRMVAADGVDCAADPDRCQDPAPWDKDYLAGFYEVPWAMAKRPFDVGQRALIIDAIALGGFGALYLADEDIRDEVQDSQSGGAGDFFDAVEPMGQFYGLLAVGAGAWATGEVTGDRSLQRVGLNGFQSVLLAAIPVELTKGLVGRSRPNKGEGNDDWFDDGNSFLSGHTTYSFAAASSIAHEYEHTGWVPWVAYGAAGLVGAQRIYDDKHWASDVLVSALVGWGIGQAVADLDAFAAESPLDLNALQTPGAQGLRLSLDF